MKVLAEKQDLRDSGLILPRIKGHYLAANISEQDIQKGQIINKHYEATLRYSDVALPILREQHCNLLRSYNRTLIICTNQKKSAK